jgi:predicted permease
LVETLARDIKYALRLFLKSPGFAAVAILTLALGIGANTAIFTLFDAVVLKTLPVPHPGKLVFFSSATGEGTEISTPPPTGAWQELSTAAYHYFRDHNQVFSQIAAVRDGDTSVAVQRIGSVSSGAVNRAVAHLVSGNYFRVMGVSAIAGRTLEPSDNLPSASPAAVLSYGYWKSQFSGDPAVIGETVILNRTPFTIVGVMPQSFFGERVRKAPDFWVPLIFQPQIELTASRLVNPSDYWLTGIARLKPGEALAHANAIVNVQLRQFLTAQAGSKLTQDDRTRITRSSIDLVPGARGVSSLRESYSQPLGILLVAVGFVLLIACANVASLLLARATGRQRETAMRLAVGASRGRLLRQWLTESLVLAVSGAFAGAALAAWGVSLLVKLLGRGVFVNVHPDFRVLLFTVAAMALTALLFGIAPALRTARIEPMLALREHSSAAGGRASRSKLARAMVVFQVALSLCLLVGAGLLSKSLVNLQDQQFGFNPRHVLLVGTTPRIAGYQLAQLPSLYQSVLERLNHLPGVRSATVAAYSPLSGYSSTGDVSVQGRPRLHGKDADVQRESVGPNYAETLGLRVLLGREIGPQDTAASPRVAMVNEAFVRRFLPGADPIGQHFGFGGRKSVGDLEIVGVVNDAKYYGHDIRKPPQPLAYFAIEQGRYAHAPSPFDAQFEIRTFAGAAGVADEIRRAIEDVAPRLPIGEVGSLRHQVDSNFQETRLTAVVAGLFSVLALALAAVGLYGLLAYGVAHRTAEIGVRMALGARPADVFRMVLGNGIRLVALGLALGILGALALTRALGSLLFGVGSADPDTFLATAAILVAVGALACYIPARRAMRTEPATALRCE